MLKRASLEKLRSRPLVFAVIGVLGVFFVVAGLGTQHGLVSSMAHETRNGTPATSLSVQKDPKPLPKVTDEDPGAPTSSTGNSAPTGATPTPATSIMPVIKPHDPDGCDNQMALAKQAYNKEVQKEKTSLDSSLSFEFGLAITSQFVTDYNTKVTDIFNAYLKSAQTNNCVWPVKAPALLPSTYTR